MYAFCVRQTHMNMNAEVGLAQAGFQAGARLTENTGWCFDSK